jgi:hypothetical protein
MCGIPRMDGAWKFLPVFVCIGFSGIALYLAVRFWRSDIMELVIDEGGISFGKEHWDWSQVRRFYAEGWATKRTIDLKMLPRGIAFGVDLPIRPRLTPAAYEKLIAKLRETLGSRVEGLELGGYQPPPSGD